MKRGCGWLAGIPVIVFGLIFTVIGAGLFISARNKRADFVSASGIIIDLVASSDSDGSTTYAPVIEYEGPEDELYRFTSRLSRNPAPQLGSTVGVLYNPDDPTDVTEDSVWLLFIFPTIALVFGLPIVGIGVFLFVRGARSTDDDAALRSKTRRAVVIGDQPSPISHAAPPDIDEMTGPVPQSGGASNLTVAQFRRVEPRGPDGAGRFEYRVVAKDADGRDHFSGWLATDPTNALLSAGTRDVQLEWRAGRSVVVNFPT